MVELLRCLLVLMMASSVTILIVFLLRPLARRAFGAAAACSTWLLVPVVMVAVLLPHVRDGASLLPAALRTHTVFAAERVLERSMGIFDISLAPSVTGGSSIPTAAWLLTVWLLGSASFLLYLAIAQRTFVNSLGIGRPSGTRAVVRAPVSAGSPAVIGIFRPKVILPGDFATRYTRQERLLVLAHERVHLRRRDAMWNAVAALLRCLFWFNPVVHLAATGLRMDQELACDAAVMERHPRTRRTYAAAMLKTQLADAALPAGCHWQSARHLRRRLDMLKRSPPTRVYRIVGQGFVAVSSIALGYVAWAAEPVAAAPTAVALTDAAATAPAEQSRDQQPIQVSASQIISDLGTGIEYKDILIRQNAIEIQADRAKSSRAPSDASQWTLQGNVRVQFEHGSSLHAGEAVVEFRQGDTGRPPAGIARITVRGTPAEFEQKQADSDQVVQGRADEIVYDVNDGTVRLTKDASLSGGGKELRAGEVLLCVACDHKPQRSAPAGKDGH